MSTCLMPTTLTEKGVQTLGSARLESLPLIPVDELLKSLEQGRGLPRPCP